MMIHKNKILTNASGILLRSLLRLMLMSFITHNTTAFPDIPIPKKLRYTINNSSYEYDVKRNDQYFLFLDQDGDGIPDNIDNDIDGDGLDNIADEFPTDPNRDSSDIDGDGIADFIDFSHSDNIAKSERLEASKIQEEIFSKYDILIIPAAKTNLEQLSIVKALLEKEIVHTSTNLNYIILEEHNKSNAMVRGKYDPEWNQLILYNDRLTDINEFTLTLTHEYFHFIQNENPKLYEDFLTIVGWYGNTYMHDGVAYETNEFKLRNSDQNELMAFDNFPSIYATVSPEEMFAEAAAAILLGHNKDLKSFKARFNNYDNFTKSSAAHFFHDHL